jgi:hypothetical protein
MKIDDEVAKVPVFSLTCLVIVTDGAGKMCFANQNIRVLSLAHSPSSMKKYFSSQHSYGFPMSYSPDLVLSCKNRRKGKKLLQV